MPLIKNGTEIEDTWVFVEADQDNPPSERSAPALSGKSYTISDPSKPASGGGKSYAFADFVADAETLIASNTPIGVRLEPGDDPLLLEPYLDKLALIEVSFPKYTDGRGYSQAQILRRRLGYEGELRAVGHVLTDQILYMNRSGFDAYSTTRAALPSVMKALSEYSAFYQPAADGEVSVFARRHRKV